MFEGMNNEEPLMRGIIFMKKKIYLSIIASFFILAGICYYLIFAKDTDKTSDNSLKKIEINTQTASKEPDNENNEFEQKEKEIILVHVCGAVRNPGVYTFEYGARMIEGIDAAGGFLDTAALEYLNLAQKMTDELRIYVPSIDEVKDGYKDDLSEKNNLNENNNLPETDDQGRININTASVKKLTELPGIGDKKAENIVNYRETNGYFTQPSDILKVNGIGESLYKNLEDKITVK